MKNKERFQAVRKLRGHYEKKGYELVELRGSQDFLQRVDPSHISALERELRQLLGEDISEWRDKFGKEESPDILDYHMGANDTKINNMELAKISDKENGLKPQELDWLNHNTEIPVKVYFFDSGQIDSSYNISVG